MKKIIILTSLFFATLTVNAQKSIDLFNGKDLSNWNFHLSDSKVDVCDVFSVKNGVIHIKGTPFGYMYTKDSFDNFRLHVEWCYPLEKTNSGIFLFVQEPAQIWPNAIECQLCKDKAGDFVLLGGSNIAEYKLPEGVVRPAFPVVKAANPSPENRAGEWNNADIICKDGSISVYINGVLQNTATNSMHRKGHIALQSEGGDILFRNVRLTPLE